MSSVHPAEDADLALSGAALLDLMQQVLARGVPFRFAAKGRSMEPFIWAGDVIRVEPPNKGRIGLGSVLAFIHPQNRRVVVHRVVGRRGDAYQLQGDNMAGVPDGLVGRDQILGQVVSVERQGRRVRYGLGIERYPIALLSRSGALIGVHARVMQLLRLLQWRRPA